MFMVTMPSEAYLKMLSRCSLDELKWLLDDVGAADGEMRTAYLAEIARRENCCEKGHIIGDPETGYRCVLGGHEVER